ncbi:MAG: hypothetical protein DMG41_33660 [Acidobacteria bacterium]|nr:MAG: hypothetical protein DMG42_14410 [Acidobacteriota bacterium]PYT82190.1 MAG: hypothetical protein DMG41_33660 [Acidobacteriota bacterium]
MKATALYRTASGLLFLWAAGNTYGLLMFWHVGYGSAPPKRAFIPGQSKKPLYFASERTRMHFGSGSDHGKSKCPWRESVAQLLRAFFY